MTLFLPKTPLFSPISATAFRRSFANSALIPEPPKHLPFTSRPNFKCNSPASPAQNAESGKKELLTPREGSDRLIEHGKGG
jgi:hypothetical protein